MCLVKNMECKRLLAFLSFFIVLLAINVREVKANTRGEMLYKEDYSKRPTASLVEEGRMLAEVNSSSTPGKDLADTVRADPLDKLKKYRDGFDITNKHYWSSTAFTGIYGYAIGAMWLLCGALFGVYLLATTFCCTNRRNKKLKKRLPCSRQCYLWPIILGCFFTFLAIIVSGVVIGGTMKFHSRAKTVIDIIIDTTDGASNTIFNVTGAMRDIRDNVAMSSEGGQTSNFLNTTSQRLDRDAAELSRQARKNRRIIDKGLNIVYITTLVVISINLVAVIALSVCGFLKFRKVFYMLIFLCWIMAALCWAFFGVYYFLENFTSDTCTALADFQQDPHNNSLSEIVPCDELVSAESVLLDTRVGMFNVINEVNRNISTLQASFGSNLIQICNPFSAAPEYNYLPGNCPPNTIRIGDIPQVLKVFTCSNGVNETCGQGQFVSGNDFRTVEAYTSSIQNLLDAFPGMESLVDCQIVKDAFTEILSKHCKPVNKYVKMVWTSMVVLSIFMVVLLVIWAVKVCQDQIHNFSDGSVKPHLLDSSTYEIDEKIGVIDQTNHNLEP